jgi:hypothetical protein
MVIGPTLHPDVNAVLDVLLSGIQAILADQFVGMYLYGSLSSGDFNPASSDIDFAVVTAGVLPAETVSALEAMHINIWASGTHWAQKLEGAYLTKDLMRRHHPDGPPCPNVNEGRFLVDRRGSDWVIQRHVIREYGVVVKGPPPKTLIDPVFPEQIRQAVSGVLHEWWFPMLDDPAWLREHGSGYHAFAVVSMCRVLHALEHGTIVSKPAAAQWTQAQFDGRWNALIEKALAAQSGNGPGFLDETLDFIRFTKEQTESRNP